MGGNSVFLAIVKIIEIICNFQKRRKDTTFFLILQTFSRKNLFFYFFCQLIGRYAIERGTPYGR